MKLAYPILIAQLIQNLMGFADTVMAGRVSATDMAAVAVASTATGTSDNTSCAKHHLTERISILTSPY